MKNLKRITQSLIFKTIAPVILPILLVGLVFYIFVLRYISDFTNQHINDSLIATSREVYNICDRNLSELLRAWLIGDDKAVRIKKGHTIGDIEDYLRQNNLKGIIAGKDNESLLVHGISPDI